MQDLRDVTAKIRAIELFNPVGLPLATDPLSPLTRPLPFTLSPSDPRAGLPFPSSSILLFLFFPLDLCLVPSVLLSLSLSLSLRRLLCRLRLAGPSLFCHGTLVRAVPLYLPPPVVPSSLKAVESNRWHTKGRLYPLPVLVNATRASAPTMLTMAGDGGGGGGEPALVGFFSVLLFLAVAFFPPRRHGIPGWDLQEPANMRPIKTTHTAAQPSTGIT